MVEGKKLVDACSFSSISKARSCRNFGRASSSHFSYRLRTTGVPFTRFLQKYKDEAEDAFLHLKLKGELGSLWESVLLVHAIGVKVKWLARVREDFRFSSPQSMHCSTSSVRGQL